MDFVDAHAHLEHEQFASDLPQVIERAKAAGVRKIVAAGSSPANNASALEIKKRFPGIVEVVAGISPHDAGKVSKNALASELANIGKWAKEGAICGIGEIGLDHHHFKERFEHDAQEHVFREQLVLAEKHSLPVVVHTRKAEEEVFEVLSDYPKARVMLHCFLKPLLARQAAGKGWMVSLPTLKSDSVEKIAVRLPVERLLCETDSPYLWKNADGVEGRNEPANVVFAYNRIAKARKIALEEVAGKLWGNARKFFAFQDEGK